jgi:hypothetical protein
VTQHPRWLSSPVLLGRIILLDDLLLFFRNVLESCVFLGVAGVTPVDQSGFINPGLTRWRTQEFSPDITINQQGCWALLTASMAHVLTAAQVTHTVPVEPISWDEVNLSKVSSKIWICASF